MSVYKDEKRNTWFMICRYKNGQGETKQKVKRGFLTKKDALSWERDFIQRQSANMDMTLETFVEIYFQDKALRLKERSVRNKRYMFSAKIIPYFGKMSMADIKPMDILNWQNSIIEQGYAETYQRMLQNQVTAIFNHAERFYNLKENPCKKVDKIGRSNAKELAFWTLEEYECFRKSFTDEELVYKTIFELLFWTGCRIGEALALTPKDIDIGSREISITKTYYRHERKDIITKPKTEKSVRIVAIPEFLCKEIEKYQHRLYGLSEDSRLFNLTDRAVQKKIIKHAELAGVKKIRVHDLRHSHIALLIHKGISPLAISERVGHENTTTTLNVYGHLYPNQQKAIAEMLEREK